MGGYEQKVRWKSDGCFAAAYRYNFIFHRLPEDFQGGTWKFVKLIQR